MLSLSETALEWALKHLQRYGDSDTAYLRDRPSQAYSIKPTKAPQHVARYFGIGGEEHNGVEFKPRDAQRDFMTVSDESSGGCV